MRRFAVIFILSSSLSLVPPARAQTETDEGNESGDPVSPAVKDEAEEAAPLAKPGKNAAKRETVDADLGLGSSERVRKSKDFGISLGFGMPIAPIPGYALGAYYQVFTNLQLGLDYSAGSIDLSDTLPADGATDVRAFELNTSLTQLYAKWFVGNSFYLGLGLGMRSVDSTIDIKAVAQDVGIKGTIEANTTAFSIRLGNQWSWDSGVTLGIDWLGYTMPLGADSKASIAQYGTAPQTEDLKDLQKDAEDAADSIGKAGTVTLLLLSLGFAF